MIDFLGFWLRCLIDAFLVGKWVVGLAGLSTAFFWIYYGRNHDDKRFRQAVKGVTTILYLLVIIGMPLYALFIAPYLRYSAADTKRKELAQQLEDKSPKLDGFINHMFVQVGDTNLLCYQVTIGNSGGLPSAADDYKLKVILTNNASHEGQLIDIPDTYTFTKLTPDKRIVFALKRCELISEKTIKAIQPGDEQRGWIAFRLPKVSLGPYPFTNFTTVLSFHDISGKQIDVTNGFYKGRRATNYTITDIPLSLAGSENLLSKIEELTNSLTWLPPELPPDCTNVTISFGSQECSYPVSLAKMSSEAPTKCLINELPDFVVNGLDKAPNYSPRMTSIWAAWGNIQEQFGPTLVTIPFTPYVVSNRLYLNIEPPFQKGKHRLIMSEEFDPLLSSLPNNWDRNFHTNYPIYEIVNEKTNPVLQVAYLSQSEILINGLFIINTNQFVEAFFQAPQLITTTYGFINISNMQSIPPGEVALGTNSIGDLATNAMYNWPFPTRKAWFKYPSNRNRSVFADNFNVVARPVPK